MPLVHDPNIGRQPAGQSPHTLSLSNSEQAGPGGWAPIGLEWACRRLTVVWPCKGQRDSHVSEITKASTETGNYQHGYRVDLLEWLAEAPLFGVTAFESIGHKAAEQTT